jgi:hypothetical protein
LGGVRGVSVLLVLEIWEYLPVLRVQILKSPRLEWRDSLEGVLCVWRGLGMVSMLLLVVELMFQLWLMKMQRAFD